MATHIDGLYELCKEQPFDTEKIKKYIQNNNMNDEVLTTENKCFKIMAAGF